MEQINQRSLFPSDVPVFPKIFFPFIEAAFEVPSFTDFSRSLFIFLFTFRFNIFLEIDLFSQIDWLLNDSIFSIMLGIWIFPLLFIAEYVFVMFKRLSP